MLGGWVEHIKSGVCMCVRSKDEVEGGAKVQFSSFTAESRQIMSKTEKIISMQFGNKKVTIRN